MRSGQCTSPQRGQTQECSGGTASKKVTSLPDTASRDQRTGEHFGDKGTGSGEMSACSWQAQASKSLLVHQVTEALIKDT